MTESTKAGARRTVQRDDFRGRRGTAPNPRHWTAMTGGYGWGNKELQYYTADRRNASLDGRGHLAIRAIPHSGDLECWYGPCRYTSARLTTAQKVTASSGRVEARIKVPEGVGLWPAFWMLGDTAPWPDGGELDIMEYVGDQPGEIWSSVHGPGYIRAGLTAPYRLPAGQRFSDDFHVYAMEWTRTGLAFSVDGNVYHRVDRADIGAGNEWVFDKPMHVVLNLAVGGEWPGDPTPETPFPATMLVDYIQVTR